jgi:hypothetical protein
MTEHISYFSDELLQPDEKKVESRDGIVSDLHYGNLFDQNEDESGEKINLVDGRPIDNSTMTDESYYQRTQAGTIRDPQCGITSGEDVLDVEPTLEEWEVAEEDELEGTNKILDEFTDAWLRVHDKEADKINLEQDYSASA